MRVVAAAGEEAPRDELVHACFVVGEGVRGDVVDRVDGRVCLVVVAALTGLAEGAVEEAGRISEW